MPTCCCLQSHLLQPARKAALKFSCAPSAPGAQPVERAWYGIPALGLCCCCSHQQYSFFNKHLASVFLNCIQGLKELPPGKVRRGWRCFPGESGCSLCTVWHVAIALCCTSLPGRGLAAPTAHSTAIGARHRNCPLTANHLFSYGTRQVLPPQGRNDTKTPSLGTAASPARPLQYQTAMRAVTEVNQPSTVNVFAQTLSKLTYFF